MSWWSNWGSSSSEAQQAAASNFLATGNIGTPIGGTQCRGSAECASGYACSGGRCVPINGQTNSDGTLSGCGGESGGPCDSLTGNNVGVKASGDSGFVYGDVVKTVNGVSTGYQWEPVYAADGCTIAGCKLGACGTENASDCPGGRYCRYDQNGNVSCSCGDPPKQACTVFCDSYMASFGAGAAGCSGKACDECTSCDGNYFSNTYNTCTPIETGKPCQCNPEEIPDCLACNEQGVLVDDEVNCHRCVEIINQPCDCDPNTLISKTCCYSLAEWKDGLSPVNRCQDEVQQACQAECDNKPAYVDPCEGECESISAPCNGTDSYGNPTPDCNDFVPTPEQPLPEHPDAPDGYVNRVTGWIGSGGTGRILFERCDMTNVPEECGFCDCNCNNDCPECQLCGADGKCYPDPSCEGDVVSTWYLGNEDFPYDVCSYNPDTGGGGCLDIGAVGSTGTIDVTTSCGPLPHTLVQTVFATTRPYGPCLAGSTGISWRVKDGDGNWITSEFTSGGVGGSFCGGPDPARMPSMTSVTPCSVV